MARRQRQMCIRDRASFAPSCAALFAIASPIPRLPPDTNITLSLRLIISPIKIFPYMVLDPSLESKLKDAAHEYSNMLQQFP